MTTEPIDLSLRCRERPLLGPSDALWTNPSAKAQIAHTAGLWVVGRDHPDLFDLDPYVRDCRRSFRVDGLRERATVRRSISSPSGTRARCWPPGRCARADTRRTPRRA